MKAVQLVGNDWLHNGKKYTILRVTNGGKTLITDEGEKQFDTAAEADLFASQCQPYKGGGVATTETAPPREALPAKQEDGFFADIQGELLYDFNRLKDDKGYLSQAKQRSDTVGKMIELAKVKIQVQKMHKG